MWNQIYNPLDSTVLSTIAAAIPVITLLVLIASGKVKAHIAAVIAADRHQPDHDLHLSHARQHVDPRLAARRGGRLLPDRLDRAQRHLPLPDHGRDRPLRAAQARGRRRHRRSPPAAAADRLLLRRVLRGRLRLRHAGRHHRRRADRARLLAAGGLRPVADRQHRAGRLWRARHADPGPRLGHRARSLHSRRDGRPAIAVLLADRAVLGGVGVRRLEGHEGRLAGDPRHRRLLRDPAIRDLELHQSLDRRHRRLADLDGLPDPVPEGVAAEGALAVAGAARQGRIGRDHGARQSRSTRRRSRQSPAVERAAAVDHRLHRHADLGQRRLQDLGELDLHLELSGARAAPDDQQDAAGGAEADPGRRGVRLHLPVLHRFRHADRGDHLRLPDGAGRRRS